MAINQISGFNPYAQSIGTQAPLHKRDVGSLGQPGVPAQSGVQESERSALDTRVRGNDSVGGGHSVAEAIKLDVAERMAQVQSGRAPDGVDQDLWSVLTKEERTFFVKTGGMGGLTYGRGTHAEGVSSMPIARGGRLDIRV